MSQAPQVAASVALEDSNDPRWLAAVRVASSSTFERSHRLQSFLLDVARHAIAGQSDKINEQQIGVRVFGKAEHYNPAEDNTVRVQARLLRHKLEEYYANEGCAEALRIQVPKGRYVPVFEEVAQATAEEPEPAPAIIVASANPSAWKVRILAGLCVLLAVVALWQWQQKRAMEQAYLPSSSADFGPLTSLVVGPSKKTVVVLADSGLVVAEQLTHQEIPVEDYSGPSYRNRILVNMPPGTDKLFWGYLLSRHYTSMADVGFSGKLLKLHPDAWKNMEVRHARDLQVRSFRDNNFVMLGSNRSTPWIDLFNDQLNFQFDTDPATGLAMVRNRRPQDGERATYISDAMPNGAGNGFAVIAYTPNLSDTGGVLLLAGTTMAATDAAAEFACDRHAMRTLAQSWGLSDLRRVKSFELLYSMFILGDTAKSIHLTGSRHTMRNP